MGNVVGRRPPGSATPDTTSPIALTATSAPITTPVTRSIWNWNVLGAVELKLRSVRNSYTPGQKPKLELTAVNSGGKACKVDLGGKGTVVTITLSGAGDAMWSSNDCPGAAATLLFKVPANGHVTHTLEWDRKASAPQCATPPAGGAKAGTYLVEARAAGLGSDQASFVLTKD